MKYLILTIFGISLLALPAQAAGYLIKGKSVKAVYYLSQEGKRYVFPNDKVYSSWYSDFSSVTNVEDTALNSWPLGGNVTYRPGSRLVKVTTDPKVYAVDQGSVLRWVTNEQVATELYGANWSKQVDDVPDTFFINYTVGEPIVTSSDFDRFKAYDAVTDVADNIKK